MNKRNAFYWLTAMALCAFCFAGCTGYQGDKNPSSTEQSNQTVQSTTEATTSVTYTTVQDTPTTKTTESTIPKSNSGSIGEAVAEVAKSLIGSSYEYGAVGPKTFDNSGFLVYCYGQNGIKLPRKTGNIAQAGTSVEKKDLKPGDIVLFYNENPQTVEFAGIYIGSDQFISSNNEETPVCVYSMTIDYFEKRYIGACRFGS